MSTLSAKDRVSLCQFTFADGRRCRTPRTRNNPHFCFYHAEKEARARAAQNLGKDLARYFSGEYLSACDLSTALGCLIPAVIRGDVKPRTARTVAYLAQTLLQSIHISQDEYINAFGTSGWRKSICNSVNANHTYRFPSVHRSGGLQAGPQTEPPSKPQPASAPPSSPPQPAPVAHPGIHPDSVGRGEASRSQPQPQPAPSPTQVPQPEIPTLSGPAPSPHTRLPRTGAEFAQQVLAGRTSSRPRQTFQGSGRHPGSAAPNAAPQSATTPPVPGPVSDTSPISAAHPVPSSPIQSSTAAQHSPQQPPPKPHPPVAATPSALRQEPRPAAGPQTGPSGLPVLATLPPRKPAPVYGSS